MYLCRFIMVLGPCTKLKLDLGDLNNMEGCTEDLKNIQRLSMGTEERLKEDAKEKLSGAQALRQFGIVFILNIPAFLQVSYINGYNM